MTDKKIITKLYLMIIFLSTIILLLILNIFHFTILNSNVIALLTVFVLILYLFFTVYNDKVVVNVYQRSKLIISSFIDYLSVFIYIVFILQLVFNFLLFPALVNQSSMTPNLYEGNRIIIINGNDEINRFNIVVFKIDTDIQSINESEDGSLWIKRVIGLPGDKIEYRDGKLYVNNTYVHEPYLYNEEGNFQQGIYIDEKGAPIHYYSKTNDFDLNKILKITDLEGDVIPDDYYLLLGDNRQYSFDSTEIGLIHKSQIIGEARYIMHSLINWEKIGD